MKKCTKAKPNASRILAILLFLAMVFSFVPGAALQAYAEPEVAAAEAASADGADIAAEAREDVGDGGRWRASLSTALPQKRR